MNELYEATQKINVVINEMNQASAEINEIASMIGGIAKQTTMQPLKQTGWEKLVKDLAL